MISKNLSFPICQLSYVKGARGKSTNMLTEWSSLKRTYLDKKKNLNYGWVRNAVGAFYKLHRFFISKWSLYLSKKSHKLINYHAYIYIRTFRLFYSCSCVCPRTWSRQLLMNPNNILGS